MDGLFQLLGLGGGGLLVKEAYDKLGDIGQRAYEKAPQYAQQAANMAAFTPYGLRSAVGNANFDAQGNLQTQLGPQQQAMMDTLTTDARTFYDRAIGPQQAREQEVYDRIRAMQQPEEARAQQDMESRLFNQGRLGITSSAYGGAPEQLAMEKAIAEAKNSASVSAIQQAMAEQMQNASLGQQYQQMSYAPQAALLSSLNPALQNAQLLNASKQYGAGLYGQGTMAGLEADLGARLGQANLMGQLGSVLVGGAMGGMNAGIANNGQSGAGGLFERWLGGLF